MKLLHHTPRPPEGLDSAAVHFLGSLLAAAGNWSTLADQLEPGRRSLAAASGPETIDDDAERRLFCEMFVKMYNRFEPALG
jgi:hypothetical protein